MRCPNCGNENPDDYTFCDECGAKLTAQDGEANATPAGADDGAAPVTTVSTMSGPMDGVASPIPSGALVTGTAQAGMPVATAGGACPNCGAATVPGEAYCNECGAELPTATDAAATSEPAFEPAGVAPDMQAQMAGRDVMSGPMPDAPAFPIAPGVGADDGGMNWESPEAMPVSEDTMAPPEGAAAAPPVATAEPAMPGVMPIAGPEEAAPPAMEPAPAPTPAYAGPAGSASDNGAWAGSALAQLEEAQQSMAKGDWVAYGQSMGELKNFLQSVVQGTAATMPMPAAAATGLPAMPPMPAAPSAPSPQQAGAAPVEPTPEPAYAGGVGAGVGARLVVISTGAEMPLPQQEEITVGREDPSSGIFPDIDLTPYGGEDGGVSRRHARMLHVAGDYFIEDLQSTNYTKLDGQRLPARVREKLEDGARIDFGRVAVIFRKS